MRRAVVAVAVLLALVGCSGQALPPVAQPSFTLTPATSPESLTASASAAEPSTPARSAVTITGKGIQKSKPFALQGDYTVTWNATPDSSVGCYHGASLERVDGTFLNETLVNELLNSKASASGETNLYGLDAARYYIQANSGCTWSFTFSPA